MILRAIAWIAFVALVFCGAARLIDHLSNDKIDAILIALVVGGFFQATLPDAPWLKKSK